MSQIETIGRTIAVGLEVFKSLAGEKGQISPIDPSIYDTNPRPPYYWEARSPEEREQDFILRAQLYEAGRQRMQTVAEGTALIFTDNEGHRSKIDIRDGKAYLFSRLPENPSNSGPENPDLILGSKFVLNLYESAFTHLNGLAGRNKFSVSSVGATGGIIQQLNLMSDKMILRSAASPTGGSLVEPYQDEIEGVWVMNSLRILPEGQTTSINIGPLELKASSSGRWNFFTHQFPYSDIGLTVGLIQRQPSSPTER